MNDFDEFWRILCEAFHEETHRSREAHEALLKHPLYQLNYIREEGRVLGFWSIWNLGSFRFMEHLAVDSCCRGKGYGSRVFRQLFETSPLPLVLEVERPDTEEARRRIEFYRRLGLHLNPYDYIQPAMQEGCGPVPLYLMSWPDPLGEAGFKEVRRLLYDKVYEVDPRL